MHLAFPMQPTVTPRRSRPAPGRIPVSISTRLLGAALALAGPLLIAGHAAGNNPAPPLRALLITGGCCHEYDNQKFILTRGISARANVEWTIVHEGGTGTSHRISLYQKDDWAAGYDVVVHNECFSDEKDPAWLERIVRVHRDGVPAVMIHCAMHCYRAPSPDWFALCGVTSHRHGSHFDYPLKNARPDHPIMKGFPPVWQTPKEELYNIAAVGSNTVALGTGYSPETRKDETCIWINQFGRARVFGTTVGHYSHTMEQLLYLDVVARGLLWACGKLGDDGEPLAGYGPRAAPSEEVIADFESDTYGRWQADGEAFGTGPVRGTLPNQQPVSGHLGERLVNSYRNGDAARGTLRSPDFPLAKPYLNFLIGGGHHPGQIAVNLLVDGKTVRSTSGRDAEQLEWATWDVREFSNRAARIEIVDNHTGGWGHINVDQITLSDTPRTEPELPLPVSTNELYNETWRPQFHFTARHGWLNDPNGLVFHRGEYHLFFQHNPFGTEWGNMTWGHAVSTDLLHWKQLPNALEPDALGTMFSGSAVVDWNNTAGFQQGREKTLVAIYTAAGGTSDASKGQPFTQCIAYSNDRGRTWTKYPGNPVLKNISDGNRDPKVFWHQPTARWIMALYVDVPDGDRKKPDGKPQLIQTIQFFASPNLKDWTYLSRIDGFFECPDLCELPVEGERGQSRWILFPADGTYDIGRFDGTRFIRESGRHTGDWGRNFYAAQTYSDIPPRDGRRILVGWMRGGRYPGMPFNQQMGIPVELTLRRFPEGIRLCKEPVRELRSLSRKRHSWRNLTLEPGSMPLATVTGDLFDIDIALDIGDAKETGLLIRGTPITYDRPSAKLTCLGQTVELPPVDGRVRLRVVVDRTSIEIFAGHGRIAMSNCYLPRPVAHPLSLFSRGGTARVASLSVRELRSCWE